MKVKKTPLVTGILCLSVFSLAQSKEAGSDRAAFKEFMIEKNRLPAFELKKDEEAVKSVLKKYCNAMEKLDVSGTGYLIASNSKIYESGSSEGNYAQFLQHHLTLELEDFRSFTLSEYNVEVQIDGKYAFTTETYNYTTITKENIEIKRKAVAT